MNRASLYMIRHGKADLDGAEAERPLMPEGIVQAKQMSEQIAAMRPRITAIYSSPFLRAVQTVKPLSEMTGVQIQVLEDLREKTMGHGDINAARRRMWDDMAFRLPGGETSAEAQGRAELAIEGIARSHPNEVVAVATHGTLLGLILKLYKPDFGYEDWRAMTMPDLYHLDVPDDGRVEVDHVGCKAIETFRIQN